MPLCPLPDRRLRAAGGGRGDVGRGAEARHGQPHAEGAVQLASRPRRSMQAGDGRWEGVPCG